MNERLTGKVTAANERSEAVTERPRASGEFIAVRRSQPPPPRPSMLRATYQSRAVSDLFRLCAAIGHEGSFDAYHYVLRTLFGGWGEREVVENAPYPVGLGDDHSPFAFGLAFAPGGIDLRLLVEAQAKDASPPSVRAAALGLNRELASRFELDFTRFSALRDLLLDGNEGPLFTTWHAARWRSGRLPAFRLYLKPRTHGIARAEALVREALGRLGFGAVAEPYLSRMTLRPGDTLRLLSFDVSSDADARVTVYAEHHGATADELEPIAAMSEHHVEGEIARFATAMVGHAGPFLWKPVTTSISFVAGSPAPAAVAVHMPISHYVDTDAVTVQRVSRFLRGHDLDDLSYRRAVHVFAPRSLESDVGVQTFASYRRDAEGPRLVAWLSPEIFRTA